MLRASRGGGILSVMSLAEIKKRIRKSAGHLRQTYRVGAVYIFGSFASGEATRKSDIDLLVEFTDDSIGMFEFLELKEFLESLLGRKVDLVTRDALKPWMLAEIERNSIRAA